MCKLAVIRIQKYVEQGGLCYYCQQPMWEGDPKGFAKCHHLSKSRSNWLRSTAEHLVARQEGGADLVTNIVAACAFCNSRRHRSCKPLSPHAYGVKVKRRLELGKWHGIRLSLCDKA